MNKQFANRYLSLIEALARGETIQFQNPWGTWIDTETPEFNNWTHYRIKPTPVTIVVHIPCHVVAIGTNLKRVLRPWTADEIPIGALFKGYGEIQRITGFDARHFVSGSLVLAAITLSGPRWSDHYYINDLVTSTLEPKYSWNGVTWHRCGIWEYKIVN